ncbi:hypothetical protein QTO34_009945 [Cnephaeus nilssonii]|uniref:Large ribosomal subunit protein uL23 N-terminal domain-containing protein n=1 Tax=Cnephaeus nilssonii TaxID=3371016 RepID=A0AA40LF07_CNENI|nr:hypothetical protein QTO34_009945 [Eptesicus nilssonii]
MNRLGRSLQPRNSTNDERRRTKEPFHEDGAGSEEAENAALKGVHSHTKEQTRTSPAFRRPKTLGLRRPPKRPRKGAPRRNEPAHCATIQSPPPTTTTTGEDRRQEYTVFTVDGKAKEHQVRQAMKKPYDIDVAKTKPRLRGPAEPLAQISCIGPLVL